MSTKPKIFIFAQRIWTSGDMVGCALAEDGTCLAGHFSSSKAWLFHDMGLTSDWKHENYREHYPEGYELEWVEFDYVGGHEGLMKACELNQAMAEEEASE